MRQRGQTTSHQSGPVAWLGLMFGPYVNPSNTNRKTAFQFWFEHYDFREYLSDKAFCRIWCHFIKKVSGRCYIKKGKKKHLQWTAFISGAVLSSLPRAFFFYCWVTRLFYRGVKDLETLFVVQNGALQSLKETRRSSLGSEMTVSNRLQGLAPRFSRLMSN